MAKIREFPGQLELFGITDTSGTQTTILLPPRLVSSLEQAVSAVQVAQDKSSPPEEMPEHSPISHARNFRIEVPYLLSLSAYNHYLKKPWMYHTEDDNLLLRGMFAGISNSPGIPGIIFDGLNALEICLMEAGIFKRKFIDFEEHPHNPRDQNQEPFMIQRNPARYSNSSRLKNEGHLQKSLYEIMFHLLAASDVGRAYSHYQKMWLETQSAQTLSGEQHRFVRLNPYDPSTLKERMDYIEMHYPGFFSAFKQVLAKPFIPERRVKIGRYGNPTQVINPEGFLTPGKTYRRGVRGMSFYNLHEYAGKVHDYFSAKERAMQNMPQ